MRRGFTLMEVLVVVILLGIVAALTIPLVTGYRDTGNETALASDLALLRSGIEMFAADHNGVYPAAVGDGVHEAGSEAAFLAHLSQYSNADGQVSDDKSEDYPFGPYLPQGIPPAAVGPLAGANGVKIVASSAALTADQTPAKPWLYSTVTGQIICNSRDLAADGETRLEEF